MTNLNILTAILSDEFQMDIKDLFKVGSMERKVIDYNEAQKKTQVMFQVLIPLSDIIKCLKVSTNRVIGLRETPSKFMKIAS